MSDLVDSADDRGPTMPDHQVGLAQTLTRRERRALENAPASIVAGASRIPAVATPMAPVAQASVIPAAAMAHGTKRVNRPRPSVKSRVSAVGTMAAVVAIVGVFALPAYAVDTTGAATPGSVDDVTAQAFDVNEDTVVATGTRDAYSATSYAEYLEAQAAVLRSSYGLSVAVAGDDYPYRGQSGLSDLGYYIGQCTDFVAWRLNRDVGTVGAPWKYTWSTMTPSGGDADQWLPAWQAKGWPVSTTPVAGSVAWFGGNHVGYVKEVYADGSFMIEDYNRVATETYGREIFQPGSIPYFLYPPG